MMVVVGNIWDYVNSSVIAITTNGSVSRSGKAVMGRGVAAEAAHLFPDLPEILGSAITKTGNHVHFLGNNIVSFPVEHTPFENPDLGLIRRSATEIVKLADEQGWLSVVVPRPGCGGGGLSWNEVRPILEDAFDERFTVISRPEQ